MENFFVSEANLLVANKPLKNGPKASPVVLLLAAFSWTARTNILDPALSPILSHNLPGPSRSYSRLETKIKYTLVEGGGGGVILDPTLLVAHYFAGSNTYVFLC